MACSHVWSFAWRKAGWAAWCDCGLAVVVEEGAGAGHGRRWTFGGRPATTEEYGAAQPSLSEQRRRWLWEQMRGNRPQPVRA